MSDTSPKDIFPEDTSPAPARRFEFTEGDSRKFWSVVQTGNALTVRYGRLGAAGQVQEKAFDSDAGARKACEKLVAEKIGKGYREVGVVAAPVIPTTPPAVRPAKPKSLEPELLAAEPTRAPEAFAPVKAQIRLDLADWLRATWRDLPTLPKPAALSFDLQDALARLRKVKTDGYGWQWDWADADIAPALTPEEGGFWFTAMRKADMSVSRTKITPKTVAAQMEGEGVSDTIQPDQVAQILGNVYGGIRPEAVPVLLSRFSLPSMLSTVIEAEQAAYAIATQNMGQHYYRGTAGLREGLRRYVLPYLTPEERQAAQAAVRAVLDVTQWPVNHYDAAPLPFYLAALFGLSEELRPVVEGWKDDFYVAPGWDHTHYHRPQDIVFGLGSAAEVEMQMRRMKLKLTSPDDVRAWLAHTETSALDYVKDVIAAETNKDEAAKLTAAMALAEMPQNAPHMLDLMLHSRAPRPARQWLDDNLAHAISGLVPVAGVRGKLSEAATEFLRTQKRLGRTDLIEAALTGCPPEAAARVRADVLDVEESKETPFDDATTPEWLREDISSLGILRMTWAKGPDLPPVVVGDHCLNVDQVAVLLTALAAQKTPQDTPHPLVAAVKAHADPAACDAFAWRLFERWRSEGAPSKERWALMAVGLLGSDASALKLAPLVRAWPGESQHARAVLGLEVLRAIGTDTALMQINGIAQKVPFKGLKASAALCMEGIAQDRGLSRPELEDRIVPDCDLDKRGSRIFDFGPRSFRLVVGPDMKPMVREGSGKARPDLPKPNAGDDAALAGKAIADWKMLKKQVAEIAKTQASRLEQAMVTGRRWPQADFETLLVNHPLMTNLVRLLVWGVYDSAGAITATFRVSEDGTYADAQENVFPLAVGAKVGIVHPLHLTPEQRSAWGELFGDYEIVPPFAQMGRAQHALAPEETAGTDITRFKDIAVPAASVVYGLDKMEWMRGLPADGGGFNEHTKPFYGANVTAVVQYDEGVGVGYIIEAPDQKMSAAFFIPGIVLPHEYWPTHKDRLPLSEIDPVVVSEVLADLTTIAAKAK